MSVHHVHAEKDYNDLKTRALVVVDFSASWCNPCKMIAPHFNKLALDNPDITFIHVDVDELEDLPDAEDVTGVPTFKFFHQGQLVHKFSGCDAKALKSGLAVLTTYTTGN